MFVPASRIFAFFSILNFTWFFRLRKKIKDFDIIHIHNVHSYTFIYYIIKASKSLKKKIVWTPHDYWFVCPNQSLLRKDNTVCTEFNCKRDCLSKLPILRRISFKRRHITKVLKIVDRALPPSNYMREVLLKFGFDREKVEMIYNGIEVTGKETMTTEKNKVLFVGYVDKRNGTYYLIESISPVKKVIPTIKLVIVGTGPEITGLKHFAKKLDIEENVTFTGRISDSKLEQEYGESNVVVLPSIWPENCSIVILEALAHGKPLITTYIGGNPELVENGISGFVVEPRNLEQIAEKIIQILSDKNLVKRLGENARISVEEKFTIEGQVEKTISVYERLVAT